MKIESFAKINLGLEVVQRRPDGFHEVRTLFQSVGLRDTLEFLSIPGGGIELTGSDSSISWAEDNLIHRAAVLLVRRHAPKKGGIAIRVIKNIPPGRGLGGGSSNAAMTLWALNRLWGLGLARRELMALGAELGSDVPYFLEGGLCLGTGRGEEVQPLENLGSRHVLLVLPRLAVSTAHIYGQHRVALTSRGKDSKIMQFLKSPGLHGLENDLEETIFCFYPLIKETKRRLHDLGPELTLVSGSGSAVFGLFSEARAARLARRALETEARVCLVETLTREQYWESVYTGV
ncbi:MAG: 4-(cytidine 5'-diphospho)-2-C-methyl-D-erythritol kinase [Candidatus Aminicenantaceae bacterium]